MYCTNCGRQTDIEANYCYYCGHPISKEVEFEHKEQSTSSTGQDIFKFVDQNRAFYQEKWDLESGRKISWNFAAFFLFVYWLGYRKMYLYAFLSSLLFLLIDISSIYILPYNNLGLILIPATMFLFGMFSNSIYLNYTKNKVNAIYNEARSQEEKNSLLKNRGGTSWLGVLLVILIYLFVYVIPLNTLEYYVSEEAKSTTNNANEPNEQVNELNEPNVQLVLDEYGNIFKDIVAHSDESGKITGIDSLQELEKNFSTVMSDELAMDYTNFYFEEKSDGIYIVPTHMPETLKNEEP